jgi:hypothetical protein
MYETWKAVEGYGNNAFTYFVSNKGKIRRVLHVGIIFKIKIYSHNGYEIVSLLRNDKKESCLLHRIIATTFIENPLNKPQVNHKDGKKSNNNVSNLEWVTAKENVNHAYDHWLIRLGEDRANTKLKNKQVIKIKKGIILGMTTNELANEMNIKNNLVRDIVKNKTYKRIDYRIHND